MTLETKIKAITLNESKQVFQERIKNEHSFNGMNSGKVLDEGAADRTDSQQIFNGELEKSRKISLEDGDRNDDNLKAMAEGYRKILSNIGEDPNREGLVDTPMRAAKAMMFFTKVRYICHNYLYVCKDV